MDDVAPVDLIGVGQRHQQPDRQAALVVFQQIHITGADPERLGHLGLGLLAIAPELAKLRADKGFCHRMPPKFTTQHFLAFCMQTINTLTSKRMQDGRTRLLPLGQDKARRRAATDKGVTSMTQRILILGASYGSLFGTKCLMAGHDVTLVCRTRDRRPHQQPGHRSPHQAEGRGRPSRHPLRRPARPPRRPDAGKCRSVRLRPGRAGDAGAAISASRHADAALPHRAGAAALPVADEHAASALSETHRGDRRRRRRRSLCQDRRLESLRPASGHAVLARPASRAAARRTWPMSCRSIWRPISRPPRFASRRSQRDSDRAGRDRSTPPGSTASTCR